MKSKAKSILIILVTIGILFTFSFIISDSFNSNIRDSENTTDYNADFNLDNKNLKISEVSRKIHIINNSGWVDYRNAGNCTGNGTYSDPYVIEDLVIDGGGLGSCILIENSTMYFKIENCTIYNSGGYYYTEIGISVNAGIKLSHVNNSYIIDNDCSGNLYGIRIEYSDNNTISGNTDNDGISIIASSGNTVSGNIMNHCGLGIYGSLEEVSSHDIDTMNLVNGKPLYYYTNEVNLGPDNFTNAGQVILVNCNDSLVSNLNISDSYIGISLHYCNNNNISGNTVNYNRYGIRLYDSDSNIFSGNTANNNRLGIGLGNSNNNAISGNTANNNNDSGICLVNSDYNTVSGNTVNYNDLFGIVLGDSNNNAISGNTANYNFDAGIHLSISDYNTVSGNTANYNAYGIRLYDSDSNIFSRNDLVGNDVCVYEDEASNSNVFENNDCGEIISGFNLFILVIPAVVIFLIAALINGKKRVCLLFTGTIGVFNIYAIFSLINSFRRDYNRNLSFFPLNQSIYYLLLTNVIFTVVALLLIKYLDEFKENWIIQKVQAFFNIAKDNIFKIEKRTDIILSLLLLFCLFYIVGFLSLFIHEFGHAMIAILFDGYYHHIFINIYLQGGAADVIVIQPSDELFFIKHTMHLLGGLIAESAFALVSIIILLKKKEKNKFGWLLSIAIIMLFLDRVALYFTFPQLFNISSDTLSMVNILNYDPWVLFFIFLPFLLVTFYFTYRMMSEFYEITLNRDKRFIGVYFLGLTIYIVILVIFSVIDRYITPIIPLTFY
jgi:parallel beta-helix repeat protein